MNRILIRGEELQQDGMVFLRDERAAHIRKVLRAAVGQSLRVGVLDGPVGHATVVRIEGRKVDLFCSLCDDTPQRPRVDLLLAMPRPKVMKRLWAQMAALGVDRIFITNAEKVERNYFDTHVLDEPFISERLFEGLQQCGDTCVPKVSVHRRLKVFLEDDLDGLCMSETKRLIAHPREGGSIRSALAESGGTRVLLALGPEGGWSEFELGLFTQHRFRAVSMGTRVLRSDTACVALLALVHDALE